MFQPFEMIRDRVEGCSQDDIATALKFVTHYLSHNHVNGVSHSLIMEHEYPQKALSKDLQPVPGTRYRTGTFPSVRVPVTGW